MQSGKKPLIFPAVQLGLALSLLFPRGFLSTFSNTGPVHIAARLSEKPFKSIRSGANPRHRAGVQTGSGCRTGRAGPSCSEAWAAMRAVRAGPGRVVRCGSADRPGGAGRAVRAVRAMRTGRAVRALQRCRFKAGGRGGAWPGPPRERGGGSSRYVRAEAPAGPGSGPGCALAPAGSCPCS